MTRTEQLSLAFSLGMLFMGLLNKFEYHPMQLKTFKVKKKAAVAPATTEPVKTQEEEDTDTFLAILWDETQDDVRLKKYKPHRVRNLPMPAITATPSPTVKHMASINDYMIQNGHTKPSKEHVPRH